MDCVVAAIATTDRVWAADIAWFGTQCIVATFAIGRADWMDRREIQHVETHRPDSRKTLDDVAKRAMPRRIVGHGAWEHFLPAGEGSLRPIDIDLTCRLMPGQEWSIIGDMHCLRCL